VIARTRPWRDKETSREGGMERHPGKEGLKERGREDRRRKRGRESEGEKNHVHLK